MKSQETLGPFLLDLAKGKLQEGRGHGTGKENGGRWMDTCCLVRVV